jgi:DNA-binding PadR family transcriptional regulator
MVESDDIDDDGPQKKFRITVEGEEELAVWLHTPPDLSSPPRDELVIKVLVARQVPGIDVPDLIQSHRRHVVELMQEWTRLKQDTSERDVAVALAIDAELFRLESVVRWLDAADGRLKRAASDSGSDGDGQDDREQGLRPPAAAMPRLRRRVGVRR